MLSTVTGNVNTILGIAVSRGVVNFSLAGYGSAHVAISGATDSPIGPVNSAPIQPDGSFTIQVHSNDSITPSGTVYLVSFSTDIGTFGAFSFAIIGNSVNLNTAVPQAPGISFTTSTAFSNGLVLYVSTSGNDSNDGKSWATAKLTLYGAVTSLPGGSSTQAGVGVIYVSDGVNAHPNAGTGLWIMGPNDPNFGSLPAGWIKAPSGFVSIVGVQSRNYGPNPHIGRAAINLGGNGVGKGSNPVFWFSSVTGGGINIENIFAQNGNQGFRIGVDSNGAITNAPSGCAGMTFVNCSAN